MQRVLRFISLGVLLLFLAGTAVAQINKWRDVHSVKKNETFTSIAQQYGITVDELKQANPEISDPGMLKKGERLFIPYTAAPSEPAANNEKIGVASRPIRLGIMLPLNSKNREGRQMVEYYRGVLMACDSVKKQGISVSVNAWNVEETTVISKILDTQEAKNLDLIIGPLHANKMQPLSDFITKHATMMVMPFAVNSNEVERNRNIFQIYQRPDAVDAVSVDYICKHFKNYHPVIIDCADEKSTKGAFTKALREAFKQRGIKFSLTSLKTPTNSLLKAFEENERNVVILNSGSTKSMNEVFSKLTIVQNLKPKAKISVLGYPEWQPEAASKENLFFKYDVYLPVNEFTEMRSNAVKRFHNKYRHNFHQDLMSGTPCMGLAGFDHAYFFLKGLHKYGKAFDGAAGRFTYEPLQAPMRFVRLGGGGYQNQGFLFVHYNASKRNVETINY